MGRFPIFLIILQRTLRPRSFDMFFLMSSRFFGKERSSVDSWVQITCSHLKRSEDLKMVYDFVMFQFLSSGDKKNFLWKKVAAEDWSGLTPSLQPVGAEFVMENKLEDKNFLVTMIMSTKPVTKILYLLIQPME